MPPAPSPQHPAKFECGQALLELAIFGMVALAALGFLIRVGMQMNYDQEIRMGAFRRALAAAGADNASVTGGTMQDAMAVTYHYSADRQMPNSTDGFMSLPRSRTEASAYVEWGDRLTFAYEDPGNPDAPSGRKTQPKIVVRSNATERTFRQNDFPESQLIDAGDVVIVSTAFPGIVSKSETVNTSTATSAQSQSGSSLSSSTQTQSTTWVNTKNGPTEVRGDTSGGGSWPP